ARSRMAVGPARRRPSTARHCRRHRSHLLAPVGRTGHPGDPAHPGHRDPDRRALLPEHIVAADDPLMAARQHLAGTGGRHSDHLPARAPPRPRAARAHRRLAALAVRPGRGAGPRPDGRRGRPCRVAAGPAALRRADGDRARDRVAGLRGPRRRPRREPDAAAADQHLLPELAAPRRGGGDPRRADRRRERRAAPDRQYLRDRTVGHAAPRRDRRHGRVGRALGGRLGGDRTDRGRPQWPPDPQPRPGPTAARPPLAPPARPRPGPRGEQQQLPVRVAPRSRPALDQRYRPGASRRNDGPEGPTRPPRARGRPGPV
ncbi:MAG: Diadenylate cyclase spyDAC; Bacterial checkpoint controller DisA with nucleotide-binding domain, partial [uncultured Thermomicrobiales bacterium]